MRLRLIREPTDRHTTLGILLINDVFQCWTLEDEIRPVKIAEVTCIPPGTYKIHMHDSARFQCELPMLEDVPGFTSILIHAGNTAVDTHGCVLVGLQRGIASVSQSLLARQVVTERIRAALALGESVTITIENPVGA
jgi:hypothetical protein